MHSNFFFGYGSLVNCDTHGFTPVRRARARGWRRAWRATTERRLAFLTAVPDVTAQIDGLTAPVPDGDWAALDQREYAYDRHNAEEVVDHLGVPQHEAVSREDRFIDDWVNVLLNEGLESPI